MVVFPKWARLVLGLVIAGLSYLISGELLHVSEELRGAIAALTMLFASAGVVPPTAADMPVMSPALRFVLTAAVTVAAYVANVVLSVDPTVRGLLVAAVALAASIGIVPPQATHTPVPRK